MARWIPGLLIAAGLWAETGLLPLKDVRQGMRGVGRTVFTGSRIDEFKVEILGVLENVGPKQSLVLARLSGGPLENAGVLQGMSGSPVYIDGRLLGAVAMAFPFSKEPVAAIRPIEEMIRGAESSSARARRASASLFDKDLTKALTGPLDVMAGGSRMVDIATPVSFSGFTRSTIDHFAPQLTALGLEPRQGMTGGGRSRMKFGAATGLKPGSMISVMLLTGDMSVGADGTVTHIDGRNVYAFGHRFLSIGTIEAPFATAEVLTLLPSLATSFKISAPRELMGTITQDRSTAVTGVLGQRAAMVPVSISVTRRSGAATLGERADYRMEMVSDRFLSPFLVQMALFSAIDATERTIGSSTLAVRGEFDFGDGTAPVKLDNMYAGEFSLPQQASLGAAVPLAYALQSGFDSLQLKNVRLEIDSYDERKQSQIDQVWTSGREVRPGEAVDLTVVLVGNNGVETVRKVSWRVPVGAPAGPLFFTVADGNTTNLTEYYQFVQSSPKSPAQLVEFLNSLRSNTRAYVRIWRQDSNYTVQGRDLPAPPPSVEQILARSQQSLGGNFLTRNSKLGEIEIDVPETVVAGARTVQVEIKE